MNDKLAAECERLRDDPVAPDDRGMYKPGHAVWCGQVRALLPQIIAALRSTPPAPQPEGERETAQADYVLACTGPRQREALLEVFATIRAQAAAEATQAKAELAGLREALRRSMVALDDWTHTIAPDMCRDDVVAETQRRLGECGSLWYIANIQDQNRAALAASAVPGDGKGEG